MQHREYIVWLETPKICVHLCAARWLRSLKFPKRKINPTGRSVGIMSILFCNCKFADAFAYYRQKIYKICQAFEQKKCLLSRIELDPLTYSISFYHLIKATSSAAHIGTFLRRLPSRRSLFALFNKPKPRSIINYNTKIWLRCCTHCCINRDILVVCHQYIAAGFIFCEPKLCSERIHIVINVPLLNCAGTECCEVRNKRWIEKSKSSSSLSLYL